MPHTVHLAALKLFEAVGALSKDEESANQAYQDTAMGRTSSAHDEQVVDTDDGPVPSDAEDLAAQERAQASLAWQFTRPLIGRGCRAWPPSATLGLPYATGSAEKRLPRAAAIGRGGGGQPLPPQPLALPTTAPLSLMSAIRVACPALENCHRGDLGVHGNCKGVIDLEARADPGVVIAGLWLEYLGRPPAADHVALGSAPLGRGAADTPSAA
ncbi:hypothetical protein B0H14DRAFT_3729327 [Mycena olivaceomarginata]|nr:hypothetical protein B0H14DRAFT_3729327 [Mycena olivaceomarginata]